MNSLEIRLLGPFEVLAGGRPARVTGSKRQALLALLALRRGRLVGVDALIDALWKADLPAAPRNAVQHHVARIRAALGRDAIVASPNGYTLVDADVDALRCEELIAEARGALRAGDPATATEAADLALELWRGPALQGLTDTQWFSAQARRLESLRVDALEERFESSLALGEHREIVSPLRVALEENPSRERLWGQLMLALYRSGRQPEALEVFHEARRVLSAELALEPGPDLRRLQEAILAQDPAIAPVPVAPQRHSNLPAPSTSFVDREREVAEIIQLLREHRLVTLTGPPGVGKSRLALEVVRSLEGDVRGRWLVDLGRAAGPDDVSRLVAGAVDARGSDPLSRAVARLRDSDAILLLDACESVLHEAARVACVVLAECPAVRVLATSREVLHTAGEVRVAVEPLALPDAASDDHLASPAMQLFVTRARAARPRFELTPENAEIVAEISRQVDGLPLAIELAAARLNVLGLAELRSLFERRLALLRDRPGSDAGRAALGTLVGWSYDLLHADEKSLLQRVAVHRGGAPLTSIVAMSQRRELDEATVTYLLGVLADKSILSVSFPGEGARYDLLDTVREYALERLTETGDLAEARRAHAEYFATLADTARAGLRSADWQTWLRRLELEHENLWAALAYARDARDARVAARLASLAWYFTLAERVTEGRRFLDVALETAAADISVAERLELLAILCYLATEEGDVAGAMQIGEQALAVAAAGAAPPEVGLAEAALALALTRAGNLQRGYALAAQARTKLGTAQDQWAIAAASLLWAQVAAAVGDVSTVAAMAADASRRSEATGFDVFLLPAALLDAWVSEQRDDSDGATKAYRRALELASGAGFGDHAAFALSGLATHSLAGGERHNAAELQRRALATAEAARAEWAAAHARVGLGHILALTGDTGTAERLYRDVLDWSKRPRPHGPRESLFVTLAEDPAVAASAGLAELGRAGAAPAASVAPV